MIQQGTQPLTPDIGTLTLSFDGAAQKTLTPSQIGKVIATLKIATTCPVGYSPSLPPLIDLISAWTVTPTSTPSPTPTPSATPTSTVTPTPTPSPSPSPTPTPTASGVSFAATISPLIVGRCQMCHSDSVTSGGINLQGYANIHSWVTPGQGNNSYLYFSVAGGPGWVQMPLGGVPLTGLELQEILDWINQGALNN